MMDHPVLTALADLNVLSTSDLEFIRRRGRSYRGVPLPSYIEPWRPGHCLDTADFLEEEGHGRFIRGWALRPGSRAPLMHAWNSPDNVTAIDASWTDQPRCSYWGLDRAHEGTLRRLTDIVNEAIDERGCASWYGSVFGGSFR